MTNITKTKVLVVGGGPGGYVAAIRAGQLGLDTTLVEKDKLGGTCLIRGCIPSKALIHAADSFADMGHSIGKGRRGISISSKPSLKFGETVRWKDGIVSKLNSGVASLLARAKVKTVSGLARFTDAKTCTVETTEGSVSIQAEHVILATGSEPVELPHLPFGGSIISSTEALSLDDLPNHLVVVGAGYIGLELGIAFRKLGSKVTIVEMQDRVLPLYDDELSKPVARSLERLGVTLHLKAKALAYKSGSITIENENGKSIKVKADKVLVTVGRRPRASGWGLEEMGVDMRGPFVKVGDKCETSMSNVWAIGDLVGEPMLAHKASAQGEMVAEIITGHRRHFRPLAIPAVCFTDPEIVSVGATPADVEELKAETFVAKFPLSASGRALTMDGGDGGGFVRIIARKDNHRILGVQAVGGHISELSAEFALAIEMEASLEDIAGVIHAHPTLSEAFFEASLRGLGHAIHA
jgi:dihydrolipoamide dehydrogenase